MKARPHAGPRDFLDLLRQQPGPWNEAKAEAFESLMAAFPDPDGPPEWGLRQIQGGQFDRRLPPDWRPAFVEVYHQWLGFRAESRAATEDAPGTWQWWRRSVIPPLRAHGWAGSLTSPLAGLALLLAGFWVGLGAASGVRASSIRRADAGLETMADFSDDLRRQHERVLRGFSDGSEAGLQNVLAGQSEARIILERLLAARELIREEWPLAEDEAATWWAWADVSLRVSRR